MYFLIFFEKNPTKYEEILAVVELNWTLASTWESKVSLLYILGEYGDLINKAPRIAEHFVKTLADEANDDVKLQLLVSSLTLFFRRPPEMQHILSDLFNNFMNSQMINIKDRALAYYRLLKYDIQEAARIMNCPKIGTEFVVHDELVREKMLKEFNTLSVVLGMT